MRDNNNAAVLSMAADLGGVRITPHAAGVLPLFIEPIDALLSRDEAHAVGWFEHHRPLLDRLTTAAGGIVLRGFAIPTVANQSAEHLVTAAWQRKPFCHAWAR